MPAVEHRDREQVQKPDRGREHCNEADEAAHALGCGIARGFGDGDDPAHVARRDVARDHVVDPGDRGGDDVADGVEPAEQRLADARRLGRRLEGQPAADADPPDGDIAAVGLRFVDPARGERDLELLAVAVDAEQHRRALAALDQRLHVVEGGDRRTVDGLDQVTHLELGVGRGRLRRYEIDHRRIGMQRRHGDLGAVASERPLERARVGQGLQVGHEIVEVRRRPVGDGEHLVARQQHPLDPGHGLRLGDGQRIGRHAVVKGDGGEDHRREQEVDERPGSDGGGARPERRAVQGLAPLLRRHMRHRVGIGGAGRGVGIAVEPHVAADRKRGDLPAGAALVHPAEQHRPGADREDIRLDPRPAADDVMPELVHPDDQHQRDHEGDEGDGEIAEGWNQAREVHVCSCLPRLCPAQVLVCPGLRRIAARFNGFR